MFLCGGRRVWAIVLTALTISAAPLTLRAAGEPDGVLNTHAALLTYPADESARPAVAAPASDTPLQVQHASGSLTVVASEPAVLTEPAVLSVSMAAPPRNDVGDAVVSAANVDPAVGEAKAYRVSASTGPAGYAVRDLGRQLSSKPEPAGRAAANTTVSSEADSRFQMPYALVLALFALIGLVPVSRRNH